VYLDRTKYDRKQVFVSFRPAISKDAQNKISGQIRRWHYRREEPKGIALTATLLLITVAIACGRFGAGVHPAPSRQRQRSRQHHDHDHRPHPDRTLILARGAPITPLHRLKGLHAMTDSDHQDHSELSEIELRVRTLESILTEKGYIDPAAVDALVEAYETRIGPRNGAQVVAKSWTDEGFAQWLREDATAAIASCGLSGLSGCHMVAVENTPTEHNVVMCTLCSCYPWPVLGLPPVWYKSAPYRSRTVMDPRGVLAEFGVTVPQTTRIRVWDSTAEVRYLVIPMRPAGTDDWSVDRLADLVTRDSMIGTGLALAPEQAVHS